MVLPPFPHDPGWITRTLDSVQASHHHTRHACARAYTSPHPRLGPVWERKKPHFWKWLVPMGDRTGLNHPVAEQGRSPLLFFTQNQAASPGLCWVVK